MTKETKKTTTVRIGCAKDIFKLYQKFLDSNEHIESFELVDDDFKISKDSEGDKVATLYGFESHITSIRTRETIPNGTTTRYYERVNGQYKLYQELTCYND